MHKCILRDDPTHLSAAYKVIYCSGRTLDVCTGNLLFSVSTGHIFVFLDQCSCIASGNKLQCIGFCRVVRAIFHLFTFLFSTPAATSNSGSFLVLTHVSFVMSTVAGRFPPSVRFLVMFCLCPTPRECLWVYTCAPFPRAQVFRELLLGYRTFYVLFYFDCVYDTAKLKLQGDLNSQ